MFLTSPLIDQAVTLKFPIRGILSAMGMLRQSSYGQNNQGCNICRNAIATIPLAFGRWPNPYRHCGGGNPRCIVPDGHQKKGFFWYPTGDLLDSTWVRSHFISSSHPWALQFNCCVDCSSAHAVPRPSTGAWPLEGKVLDGLGRNGSHVISRRFSSEQLVAVLCR